MTTTNLATAKEVATAVASLGFQASSETLGAISRNCREDFLEHLSRCITDQDQDGSSKKFIGNLLRCLAQIPADNGKKWQAYAMVIRRQTILRQSF